MLGEEELNDTECLENRSGSAANRSLSTRLLDEWSCWSFFQAWYSAISVCRDGMHSRVAGFPSMMYK